MWRIRERDSRSGIIVAEQYRKNLWTSAGLTALASGTLPQTLYLAVENPGTTITSTVNVGATSITCSGTVLQAGDTQIVASVGLVNQEVLTTTGTGTVFAGNTIYTLTSPATQSHAVGDLVCRQVLLSDTMTNVQNEQQYDSVNFPGQRAPQAGGYSPGVGQWTYQFFFSGPTLQTTLMMVGMCDSPLIGQGNLLNHFTFGYSHTNSGNDLEIDGTLTLSNI